MERVPNDVIIAHVFTYLDGRDLSRLRATSLRFRNLVDGVKWTKQMVDMHHVRLNSHLEFLEEIGNPVTIGAVFSRSLFGLEGYRTYEIDQGICSLSDFYIHGNLEGVKDAIAFYNWKNAYYKLITYPQLSGNQRFDLGNGLGTIHRGASLFMAPIPPDGKFYKRRK